MEATTKTRGRKAAAPVEPVEGLTQAEETQVAGALAAITEEVNVVTALEQKQTVAFDLGQQVGRIQALRFISAVAEKPLVETFIQIRETKKYKDIQIQASDGTFRTAEDFFEFCELVFGKSYKSLAEMAQNYEALGAELFEQAERIGLRRNEYRALRALPDDEQKLVQITLAEAGDRESVVGLINELADRQAQERAALRKEIEQKDADIKAKDKLLEQKSERLNDAEAKLARRLTMPETELAADVEASLNSAVAEAIGALQKLTGPLRAMDEEFPDGRPGNLVSAAGGALSRILLELQGVAAAHGVALMFADGFEADAAV